MKRIFYLATLLCLCHTLAWAQNEEVRLYPPTANLATADSIDGIYIPKNLAECGPTLDLYISSATQEEILSMGKGEFSVSAHFGLGRWIRNNFGLWQDSRLMLYFKDQWKYRNYQPDDISDIILREYYDHLVRKKNGEEEKD